MIYKIYVKLMLKLGVGVTHFKATHEVDDS